MMHTVHCLFFITEHHHLSLEVVHLPGKNNVAADVLSRNNYPLFFQVSPGARPDPSPIPSQTLRPLVQDWTLINWKGLFVACTGGAYHLPLRGHTSQGRNAIWTPAGTSPLPVEEHTHCQLVAFLRTENFQHQAAKSYLSAVRHLQISQGMGDCQCPT